jgi:hypothetical protein
MLDFLGNLKAYALLPVLKKYCADVEPLSSATKDIDVTSSQEGYFPEDYDSSHDANRRPQNMISNSEKIVQEMTSY